jgi:cephalosporin hydroxylase
MSKYIEFKAECSSEVTAQSKDSELLKLTKAWFDRANRAKYSYHFEWMGRPIIQYPQDIVAMQEIIFSVKPDLIIETGIAHGGSLILYASLLELNAACGGPAEASILGVDIDIRTHNKEAIEAHPMSKRIEMIQGSSIATEIVDAVKAKAQGKQRIMVVLDSNHTHEHVLAELEAYAPLVTKGSYCVVFDTVVEDMPKGSFPDRPWDVGNNPKTAVWEYLKSHDEFEIDKHIQHKLLITVAPDGFLKRI